MKFLMKREIRKRADDRMATSVEEVMMRNIEMKNIESSSREMIENRGRMRRKNLRLRERKAAL